MRTPCTFTIKHICTQKLRLFIRNAFTPTLMENVIRIKSYDCFNKKVNLPPPKNKNELKLSESYFLAISHRLTKFQHHSTSLKITEKLLDTLGGIGVPRKSSYQKFRFLLFFDIFCGHPSPIPMDHWGHIKQVCVLLRLRA